MRALQWEKEGFDLAEHMFYCPFVYRAAAPFSTAYIVVAEHAAIDEIYLNDEGTFEGLEAAISKYGDPDEPGWDWLAEDCWVVYHGSGDCPEDHLVAERRSLHSAFAAAQRHFRLEMAAWNKGDKT